MTVLAATSLRRGATGLFDTKKRCSAASAAAFSAWGLSIFLSRASIRAPRHYPHSGLFFITLISERSQRKVGKLVWVAYMSHRPGFNKQIFICGTLPDFLQRAKKTEISFLIFYQPLRDGVAAQRVERRSDVRLDIGARLRTTDPGQVVHAVVRRRQAV